MLLNTAMYNIYSLSSNLSELSDLSASSACGCPSRKRSLAVMHDCREDEDFEDACALDDEDCSSNSTSPLLEDTCVSPPCCSQPPFKFRHPRESDAHDQFSLGGKLASDVSWLHARIRSACDIVAQLDFSTVASRRIQSEASTCAQIVYEFIQRYPGSDLDSRLPHFLVGIAVQYATSLESRWDMTDRTLRVSRMLHFAQSCMMCMSSAVDLRSAFAVSYPRSSTTFLPDTMLSSGGLSGPFF